MIYNVTHHDLEFVFSCYTKKLLIRLSSVPGSKWFGQCANQILQESLLHLPTSFYCISRAHTEQVRLIVDFICMLSADSSRPLVHTMDGSALVKDSRATNCQSGRAQIIRITSNKDDRLGLLIFAGVVIFELLFTTHMILAEALWTQIKKLQVSIELWESHVEPLSSSNRGTSKWRSPLPTIWQG